jgi:HEAT repeat protein
MEYHALIGVHHESIAPPMTAHLPSYNTESEVTAGQPHNVGKKASSSFSDHLSARYPYPEDVHYDHQEPSIAYGRKGATKSLAVLRELLDDRETDQARNVRLKLLNVAKLREALSDHRSIGDTVNSKQQSSAVSLLKELLMDADPGVRQGAAGCLGRLAMLFQGRQALCQSGCAEALAGMLEDMDSADVRLEAGKTLKTLTDAVDGRESTATMCDGAVVVKMVRALLAISAKHSSLATPGLPPLLLESLSSVLVGDNAIQVALAEGMMPFLVYTLKKRRLTVEAMKALVTICNHPTGKKAAIEAGALAALCGLLASGHALIKPQSRLSSALIAPS